MMAAAITVASSESGSPLEARTVSGSGLTASTAYIVTASLPSGAKQRVEVTTDGSGAFSFPFVSQERGTTTFTIRLRSEWEGTTAAVATATRRVH